MSIDNCNLSTELVHEGLDYWADIQPNEVFLLTDDQKVTFGQMREATNAVANELIKIGVKPGDMVGVMMSGSREYLSIWLAISKIGAIEVPINTAYKGMLLEHVINTAKLRYVLSSNDHVETLEAACSKVDLDIDIISDTETSSIKLSAILAGRNTACPDIKVNADQAACVLFTSGTTGPSKGVVMSHAHQVSFGTSFNHIVSLKKADTTYNYLPFFHIAAKFLALGSLVAGARMALTQTFSLSRFWPDVEKFEATVCIAVGGLCHMLRGLPPSEFDFKNSLRLIYAVPRPTEFLKEFEKRFQLEIAEGYGSTETNLVVYTDGQKTPDGSCGRSSPFFDVVIMDEAGNVLPPNSSGEICVRPHHPNTVMKGYLDMPEKTLEAFSNLWLHTGDRGYVDKDGFFYFQDRMKDAMRRRGENISSFEVERMVNAHPDVVESAVVAADSELDEDEVLAVIVLKEESEVTNEQLLTFFAETMPYFMVPRYIRTLEKLPRTPTHKVRKVELRQQGVTQDTWDCILAGLKVTKNGIKRQ